MLGSTMRGKRCSAPPPRDDLIAEHEVTIDGHRHQLRPGVELSVRLPDLRRKTGSKLQRVKFRRLVTNAEGHQWLDAWDGRMVRSFQLALVVTVHRNTKMVES